MTKYLLMIIGVLLVCVSVLTKCNSSLKQEQDATNQTLIALTDSIKVIKVNGKNTVQKAVFTQRVAADNRILNANQKALFSAVDKHTLAAAHIVSRVDIRDVVNTHPTLLPDSITQRFKSDSDTLRYTITVKPGTLSIDTLQVPNTALISFTQDKKNVVVNITNSNPLLKTNDVQGYVIPKEHVTLWQKIKRLIF